MLQQVRQRGFTLIEVIIVIALIALLAATVAPNLLSKADGAKRKAADTQLVTIGNTIEFYKLEVGSYPQTLQDLITRPSGVDSWQGPYLKKKAQIKDPWGKDIQYNQPGEHGAFDLLSYGSDGQLGGEGDDADITSWE